MGFCENRYDLSCFMIGGEFLDKLIDCWLSKKDFSMESVRFQKCCNLCVVECVIKSEKQQFK